MSSVGQSPGEVLIQNWLEAYYLSLLEERFVLWVKEVYP